MFVEFMTSRQLLSAYLKTNHPAATVLVIWTETIDSDAEWDTVRQELGELGHLPPANFMLPGILIIEMPKAIAGNLVNRHNKGGIIMEVYENGECIHENQ